MKNRKLKFTMYVCFVLTLAIVGTFATMILTDQNLTTLALGLAGLLVFDVGAYSTLNVIQKNNIAKNYIPEMNSEKADKSNAVIDQALDRTDGIVEKVHDVTDKMASIIKKIDQTVEDLR